MKKKRLDVLLVERGLAETEAKARALILAGSVIVNDQRSDKAGAPTALDAALRLKGEVMPYVSRGGLKLKAALDALGLDVTGAVCADIGASTGGFTDCLLQSGAARVHAIDVGYGLLHERLRQDARVISHERVNARSLSEEDVPEPIDVMVIDVSFISLKTVLPSVLPRLKPQGTLIALVKPQFELEAARIGEGGVVRDPEARREVIDAIRSFVSERGFTELLCLDSPVHGPAGNVEALLAARKTGL